MWQWAYLSIFHLAFSLTFLFSWLVKDASVHDGKECLNGPTLSFHKRKDWLHNLGNLFRMKEHEFFLEIAKLTLHDAFDRFVILEKCDLFYTLSSKFNLCPKLYFER